MKNTDAKSAPEGAASITVSGGLERYTEISRKIRRLRSLPTNCDLEVLQSAFVNPVRTSQFCDCRGPAQRVAERARTAQQPWPNAAPGATCGPWFNFCGPYHH